MIDFDKIVFDVLVASVVKDRVKGITYAGLQSGARGVWQKSILLGIVMIFIALAELVPLYENMHEYSQHACDGNQDFVLGHSMSTGLYFSAPTNAYQDVHDVETLHPPHQGQLVQQMIFRSPDQMASVSGQRSEPSITVMAYMMSASLDRIRPERGCVDLALEALPPDLMVALRMQTGQSEIESCNSFSFLTMYPYAICYVREQTLLRSLCPYSCGCSSPHLGLLWLDGCPDSCAAARPGRGLESLSSYQRVVDEDRETKGLEKITLKCDNLLPYDPLTKWKILRLKNEPTPAFRYLEQLSRWFTDTMALFDGYDEVKDQMIPLLMEFQCPKRTRHFRLIEGLLTNGHERQNAQRILCGMPQFAYWCPDTCDCHYQCRMDTHSFPSPLCNPDCNPVCTTDVDTVDPD